jgi:hypothetical protein
VKALQACLGGEAHAVWPRAIKRLVQRYLERRNARRALQLARAENKLAAPYEGRRWCDATERELIDHIANRLVPRL